MTYFRSDHFNEGGSPARATRRSVRVHTGGNRAKPPQARKARRPTTAGHRGVLRIRSAEFGGSGVSPLLAREWMANDYLKKFAPVATHLSSPTSATKSAQSGLMHCSKVGGPNGN